MRPTPAQQWSASDSRAPAAAGGSPRPPWGRRDTLGIHQCFMVTIVWRRYPLTHCTSFPPLGVCFGVCRSRKGWVWVCGPMGVWAQWMGWMMAHRLA